MLNLCKTTLFFGNFFIKNITFLFRYIKTAGYILTGSTNFLT